MRSAKTAEAVTKMASTAPTKSTRWRLQANRSKEAARDRLRARAARAVIFTISHRPGADRRCRPGHRPACCRENDDGNSQRARQEDRIVAVDDTHEHELADAGQEKDVLNDDDATKQPAEFHSADRYKRNQSVPERVVPDDAARGGALR